MLGDAVWSWRTFTADPIPGSQHHRKEASETETVEIVETVSPPPSLPDDAELTWWHYIPPWVSLLLFTGSSHQWRRRHCIQIPRFFTLVLPESQLRPNWHLGQQYVAASGSARRPWLITGLGAEYGVSSALFASERLLPSRPDRTAAHRSRLYHARRIKEEHEGSNCR